MRKNTRSRFAIICAAVAGLSLQVASEGSAHAQSWQPIVFKIQDADPNDLARVRNGRLRKTDEEFTNEQGTVAFFAGGRRGLYVEMRTGALSTGEKPVHRMQAACTPFELVQDGQGLISIERRPGEKFITDNIGNEYRNANKPQLMPINNGRNMLVMFNYQPQGTNDTRRYAKVLDQSCNLVPVRNANGELRKQVLIMAKNNDDCDMHQTGEGPCDIATDVDGVTHMACWAGCNGNGRDDGWLNDITVSCKLNGEGYATECTIRKNFDISLARREERSRGRCTIADEDPNTAICTWTEGNNQPQRDGTWIAAVDISPEGEKGEDAKSRLIWKEMIDGQKQHPMGYRTYSVRAMHTRVLLPRPDGTLERTNMLFFRAGDLQGANRDDKKGGTYRAFQIGVIKATRAGMEWVVPLHQADDMLLGIDGTHLTMCGAVFGEGQNLMPGFTLLQGSHNGGGVTEPVVKAIALDMTSRRLVDLGTHRAGGSYDRHLYSNYLGNNPGNQGRNFAGCALTRNPFAGQNGSMTQYFVAHALTGKSPENVGKPELKPSSFVTLLPVARMAPPPPAPQPPTTPTDPVTVPPTDPAATDDNGATDNGTPEDPADDPATAPSMMGCSASAGGAATGGAAVLVLGVMGAMVGLGRRRSRD